MRVASSSWGLSPRCPAHASRPRRPSMAQPAGCPGESQKRGVVLRAGFPPPYSWDLPGQLQPALSPGPPRCSPSHLLQEACPDLSQHLDQALWRLPTYQRRELAAPVLLRPGVTAHDLQQLQLELINQGRAQRARRGPGQEGLGICWPLSGQQDEAKAHRSRAAPGAPGRGQPPQRDEAGGRRAARCSDGPLGHLPTVHIEPDLGASHGHVHLRDTTEVPTARARRADKAHPWAHRPRGPGPTHCGPEPPLWTDEAHPLGPCWTRRSEKRAGCSPTK